MTDTTVARGDAPRVRIAYLTSQYPATSHTFIRREIAAVRQAGTTIDTFSVRAPGPDECKSEIDRREADRTYTLLAQSPLTFAAAHVQMLARAPLAYLRTVALALRHRAPGLRAMLLSLAHFAESILLARELRRRSITHLHNHFANSGATVGMLAAHCLGIRWSFTIHGISEFDYPAGLTLPDKIAAADFVACVSYFGRAQAMRMVAPDHWDRLAIVRCGLALDELPPRLPRPEKARAQLIAVGRLSAEKGHAGLFEALAMFPPDARPDLTLVGDGPLREALEDIAARCGIGGLVRFVGRKAEAETLALIAQSDILVLPSFMEGLPIVLMEAMALGTGVVTSRVAGIPELVEEGRTGFLFTPSDWDDLHRALRTAIEAQPESSQMHSRAQGKIAADFDIRKSAQRMIELFAAHSER